MADKMSRGGLGWFVIGLLIGVAGTLATQRFVQSGSQGSAPAEAIQPAAVIAEPPPPTVAKPKPAHKAPLSDTPRSSAAPTSVAAKTIDQQESEVDDDAAAAGMTSRARPDTAPPY